jgi:hypothetical protein
VVEEGAEWGRMEEHCERGQSPPQAVMPRKKKNKLYTVRTLFLLKKTTVYDLSSVHYSIHSQFE